MTRRISSITTVVVGAALIVAAPALGDPWGADRHEPVVHVSPDLVDRAAAVRQKELSAMLDARERSQVRSEEVTIVTRGGPVRDDRFRLDSSTTPAPAASTASGRDIEWPQVGLGFAIGVLLVTGLGLAMRTQRVRQPAH